MTAIRDSITTEEQAAIDAFKSNRAEQAEAQRKANRSLEETYIDRFHELTEGPEMPPIMDALATIAAFFHNDDPEFVVAADPDLEIRGTDPNNAQWNQKGIMANLCNQAEYMLKREINRFNWTRTQAARARQTYRQGEIDRIQLEAAELDYGRSKVVNLPMCEDFAKAVKTAYLAQFGEEWTPRPKADDPAKTQLDLDERFSHSERRQRL